MGEEQDATNGDESSERGSTLGHDVRGKAHTMPSGLIDNAKSRMLL
jgi:hypothetical protein